MNFSDLRIFSAVVSEGSITRAAEKLHRVQSADGLPDSKFLHV